jgi:curved DNA-binding protein
LIQRIYTAVKYQDYYETLDVPRNAAQDKIQASYRKLARKYHPDLNKEKGAEERFKQVGEAYEVLGDAEKRKKYDQLGRNWHTGDDFSPPPGWQPAGAQRGNTGFAFDGFGEGFSDFFDSLFGGFGKQRAPENNRGPFGAVFNKKGPDHEAELTIPLEDAFRGARRSISLKTTVSEGPGRSKTVNKKLEVAIPKGVSEGKRLRLGGQGGNSAGGKRGDLYLTIHIAPHPKFRVVGSNIEVDVPVTPWEAALGGDITVPLIDGTARITLPPGITTGKKVRVKGKGLPNKGEEKGDLYATMKIVVPETLSKKEKELFQELAEISQFKPRA